MLYYLYSEVDSDNWKLLASTPFESDFSVGSFSWYQHVNGKQRVNDVTLKQVKIYSIPVESLE